MSGRHAVHVVGLAGGGSYLMKAGAIPRSHAPLDVVGAGRQDVIALAEYFIKGRVAVARSRFDARYGVGNGLRSDSRRGARRWFGSRYRRRIPRRRREAARQGDNGG